MSPLMDIPCQSCHEAKATVHLTDCTGGEPRERHLCEACAEKEGVTFKQSATLSWLLEDFAKHGLGVEELARKTCPHCATTFIEFRNTGLLGCPHDYEVFEQLLAPLIQRAHNGAQQHVGRVPGGRPVDQEQAGPKLVQLRRALKRAVEAEEYELAAKLRDQIEALNHVED